MTEIVVHRHSLTLFIHYSIIDVSNHNFRETERFQLLGSYGKHKKIVYRYDKTRKLNQGVRKTMIYYKLLASFPS